MRLARLVPTLVVSALVFAAPSLRAQTLSDSADAALRAQIKSDLRNLVTAQEAYYAGHSAYAPAMDGLSFRASNGDQVSLTVTQNNSWAAVATHPSRPGKSCVVYVNVAAKYQPKTMQSKLTGGDGQPVCDGDPPPSSF